MKLANLFRYLTGFLAAVVCASLVYVTYPNDTLTINFIGQIKSDRVISFKNKLSRYTNKNIKHLHVYINSQGGSLLDAFAIFDRIKQLRERGVEVTCYLEGKVLSAAVIIALACDNVVASKNCVFMVHMPDPPVGFIVEKTAEVMACDTPLTVDDWLEKMAEEKWFDVEEAIEWGLVDRIK